VSALLHHYASRHAESHPSDVAVVLGGDRITYGELEADSNRLPRVICSGACRPGDRVGRLMPKSPVAVVAMHAALKAGAVYVPIAIERPAARIAKIVQAAEPRLILATPDAAPVIDQLVASGVLRWG
jgi:acyl-CoA synthetase (AMP-forming)/AMP-acid ligase II